MTWPDAIELILKEADEPLDCNEITEKIVSDGIKRAGGPMPYYSVQAAISRDLKKKGNQSIFCILPGDGRLQKYWLKEKLSEK